MRAALPALRQAGSGGPAPPRLRPVRPSDAAGCRALLAAAAAQGELGVAPGADAFAHRYLCAPATVSLVAPADAAPAGRPRGFVSFALQRVRTGRRHVVQATLVAREISGEI